MAIIGQLLLSFIITASNAKHFFLEDFDLNAIYIIIILLLYYQTFTGVPRNWCS